MDNGFEVSFSKKAKNELLNAFDWYEEQSVGLGDRFLNELFSSVESFKKHPNSFVQRIKNHHEFPLQNFPFLIIYRISKKKNTVVIVSVFHAKRNPKRKYK
ncbi:MAG: hypothetical protein RL708_1648 [Bacteroidota bacterium]|jgi:plasmid stabilization system protein ParE